MTWVRLGLAAAAAGLVAGAGVAAPVTYVFSGTLSQVSQYTGVQQPFAVGQTFRGTVTYDFAAIQYGWNAIESANWTLRFNYTPLVSLAFEVDTAAGTYSHVAPTQNLLGSAWQYAAVGRGIGGWNGVSLRTMNYPELWQAGPPSAAVPPSSFIGAIYPHSTWLDVSSFGDPTVLADLSGDVDLANLFGRTGAMLSVRFSDPSRWTGSEWVDLGFNGRVTSFAVSPTVVPEPATWAMLIVGFGLVGAAARRRAPAQGRLYDVGRDNRAG